MKQRLLDLLESRGLPARIVSVARLCDLEREYESRRARGGLLADLDQDYFSRFAAAPPAEFPVARSIIVVAVAQPLFRLTFHWNGTRRHCLVPPTYLHGERTIRGVEKELTALLRPEGYRVVHALVAEKLLAVRSGLARYGRNNISYVEGMGSFYRPVPFFSDLPCPDDDWQEARMLELCSDCAACRRNCPAGAIPEKRVPVRVERCITYHNEKPTSVPFPAWIDPDAHECLVGCLHCQRSCPGNRSVRNRVEEGAEFSAEQTRALAAGTPVERMPATLVDKLERWDLTRQLYVLPRNLKAILESGRAPRTAAPRSHAPRRSADSPPAAPAP
jgi:epoxyqueuosine reductase